MNQLFMPTRVMMGKGCIKENASLFSEFGKKAMIVTGKTSAKKSGALTDVTEALKSQAISYVVFDEVENNPSVETCFIGGQRAKAFS